MNIPSRFPGVPRIGFFATIIAMFAFSLDAAEPNRTVAELFSETIIVEQIRLIPDTSNLGPEELATLHAGKGVLTEFFRRLSSSDGKSALELLASDYRAQYDSADQFFRAHVDAEAILSYQIFGYTLCSNQTHIIFRFFLTHTLEGVDTISQRTAELHKSEGAWKITQFDSSTLGC
jgi:hypothetical protein